GAEITYTLSGDIDETDVAALTGTATVTVDDEGNGTATISVELIADEVEDDGETLTVTLDADETATADVIVNDAEPTPPATYVIAADAEAVIEGNSANFTVNTTGLEDGAEITYTLSGDIDETDVATLTGTATVTVDDEGNGTATISVELIADEVEDDGETLTVTLDADTTKKATVTVNDPAVPTDTTAPVFTSLAIADAVENQAVLYTAVATDD
ncbi:hypothetical protein, partial [Chromatium okenii]|uniref:hypothetical protein n=1 Tax=Chromatium okenii TaxID=61644 RepID=UPI0026EF3A98